MAAISLIKNPQPQTVENRPGSWLAAFLAGLPHLIMGLLVAVGKFGMIDSDKLAETGMLVTAIILVLLVVVSLLFAWRRGWPLWSASWYLYGTWVSMAVLSLVIEKFNWSESWRFSNALFFIWIAVCIIGYFMILIKSRLHGLLSVAFFFPMLSVMMFEFVPNPIEGWFAIAVGLLAALAAGIIVRVGEFRSALILILGLNFAVGLVWAYISEYEMLDLPTSVSAHAPHFINFLEYTALYSFFGIGVVAVPFILRALWNFGRRKLAS